MANLLSLKKEILRIKSTYNGIDKLLNGGVDPIILELKEKYKASFADFAEDFWPYAGTSTPLVKGYAFDARVIHAEALQKRQIKFLLWAEPPKEGKSTFFNVLLPAWMWLKNPQERFLNTCYAERYACRDNEYMQKLIEHQAYNQLFGIDFHLTKRNRHQTQNNVGGERTATSLFGQNTGTGGSVIMFDDPNSISDYEKPDALEKVSSYFDNIFVHRQIDPKNTVFFIGQHRVSPSDLYGHVKEKNNADTVAVEMPFEFEVNRRCTTYLPGSNEIFWQDPRTYEGEFINPDRHTKQSHEWVKSQMPPLSYSSLFQCSPIPSKGGVFEREWFKIWNQPELPDFEFILTAWDTAISISNSASFSAAVSFGIFRNENGVYNVMLLSIWYGREEWTDLRKMAIRLSKNIFDTEKTKPIQGSFPASHILIEGKANGISLAQSLRDIGINAIKYIPPAMGSRLYGKSEDGKIQRARMATPYVESGRVFVMGKYPYNGKADYFGEKFMNICVNFPHNIEASKDIMDCFSMTIDYLSSHNFIGTSEHFKPQRFDEIVDRNVVDFKEYDHRREMRVTF